MSTTAIPASTMTPTDVQTMIKNYPWSPGSGITLLLSLDFGTVHSTAAVQIVQESCGSVSGNVKFKEGLFVGTRQRQSHRVPSKVAITSRCARALGKPKRCVLIFGHDVDKALEDGCITNENVFDLLKLFLFPEYASDDSAAAGDRLMKLTRAKHDALIEKIARVHGGKVLYRDRLDEPEWEVRDMGDVVVAYLHFIWHNTLLEVAHKYNIDTDNPNPEFENLRQIFANKMHVAVSVPTVWQRETQEHFLNLLGRAGFPGSTAVVSEAVSAAIGHLNMISDFESHTSESENMIVADIGGATLGVAGVRKYFRDGLARFGEIVPEKGAINGSLLVNQAIKEYLDDKTNRQTLKTVLKHLDWKEDEWSQHIKDGIEEAKRLFKNTDSTCLIPLPRLGWVRDLEPQICRGLLPGSQLTVNGLIIGNDVLIKIHDEWLKEIVHVIRECQNDFQQRYPKQPLPALKLCGWGSLPRHVLQKCTDVFPGVPVTLLEDQVTPIVANGNLVTLLRADLFFEVPACRSYGIRHDIPWQEVDEAHQRRSELQEARTDDGDYLLDRALWVVEKGQSLIHPTKTFTVQSKKRLSAPNMKEAFPFEWDIDIVASDSLHVGSTDKYVSVSQALAANTIQIVGRHSMTIHQQDCKIKAIRWDPALQEPAYIEFEFRVRVDCSTIRPHIHISIPKSNGIFREKLAATGKGKSEPCHRISASLGSFLAHTTFHDNEKARLDVDGELSEQDKEARMDTD
ncbi:hypothetical protein AYO21_03292 [Fonsecaea monophora]|uniref:Uncharacterized protein n=1 Tax=Fonsecaea monophora TaxID=254056 RepID=A0A177FF62_9EURO|nr:hypothetical protein AYO21_03292 [Fonsecaea monophora]OAG42416.1 hypothetical protein AYO21_03292 [Fonsecaea monophora]